MTYNPFYSSTSKDLTELDVNKLRPLIAAALNQCQAEINANPNQILNESDFEKLLARLLEEKVKGTNFSVHTQLAGYYKDEWDKQKHDFPDIVLLQDGFEYDEEAEKYKNEKASITFELKYLHTLGGTEQNKVKGDFNKQDHLKKGSFLYVIVLIDIPCHANEKNERSKKLNEAEEIVKKIFGRKRHKKAEDYTDEPVARQVYYKVLEKKVGKTDDKQRTTNNNQ